MHLADDKLSVTVAIEGVLSAIDVDSLIAELAAVRAHMLPAAPPKSRPGGKQADTGRKR